MSQRPPDHVDAAIAELKAQVKGLDAADRELKSALANLADTVAAGFRDLTSKIDSRNVTPWGTIIGFATALILGMTAVGGLARQPLVDGVIDVRSDLQRERDLRRADDVEIRSRLDKTRTDIDHMRGQFDVLFGTAKRQ